MIDFSLTPEQLALQRAVRQFSEKEIKPIAPELDRVQDPRECFPFEVIRKVFDLGYHTIFIPEEYGGGGKGDLEFALIGEELAAADAGVATTLLACGLTQRPLFTFGTPEQKKHWLSRICSSKEGPFLSAIAITEPGSGSDFASPDPNSGVRATAVKDGNDYVINGQKCFITNGGVAKLYTVYAKTDITKGAHEGLSCFLVPSDANGLSIGKIEDKMGQRLSQQSELILDEVRVPKERLLGPEGGAVALLLDAVTTSCAMVGALCVGLARAAYECALQYARERVQGGMPIINHQAVGFKLVDMKTRIEACRALVHKACWNNDHVRRDPQLALMSKVYCSDMAMEVTTEAVQILGGYGYMRDYPAEKYMRDAKVTQIYDGSNERLRLFLMGYL